MELARALELEVNERNRHHRPYRYHQDTSCSPSRELDRIRIASAVAAELGERIGMVLKPVCESPAAHVNPEDRQDSSFHDRDPHRSLTAEVEQTSQQVEGMGHIGSSEYSECESYEKHVESETQTASEITIDNRSRNLDSLEQ